MCVHVWERKCVFWRAVHQWLTWITIHTSKHTAKQNQIQEVDGAKVKVSKSFGIGAQKCWSTLKYHLSDIKSREVTFTFTLSNEKHVKNKILKEKNWLTWNQCKQSYIIKRGKRLTFSSSVVTAFSLCSFPVDRSVTSLSSITLLLLKYWTTQISRYIIKQHQVIDEEKEQIWLLSPWLLLFWKHKGLNMYTLTQEKHFGQIPKKKGFSNLPV